MSDNVPVIRDLSNNIEAVRRRIVVNDLPRVISVVTAEVGTTDAADGDGAYDLLDLRGTPEEVGRAIGENLRETRLLQGSHRWLPEQGPMFMRVVLRVDLVAEHNPEGHVS
jgi:hypothetical protein